MKKKPAINFGWPASLSDFTQDTSHEQFTRGKLKVFYQGETADHRFFSEKFAKELVKTLPYTPVVSYYDEEKEDFVGHATEQQIYGMVDPMSEPSFETDDTGTTWCVCDVVLYTERPDKVGDIAKKIVGHKQSLELDPKSAEYVINYDEKKHFKNIEFTAGKFVGVSVLGNDQQPAFTGSEFFAYNAEFESKMKILREYCESKEDHAIQGGNKMNYSEFIKLSWGEAAELVMSAICKAYENDAFVGMVDMFDDSVICNFYYYVECKTKLMRVAYEIADNGDVKLGKVNEVRVVYEDVEVVPTQTQNDFPAQDSEQQEEVEAPVGEEVKEESSNDDTPQKITIEITAHEEQPTEELVVAVESEEHPEETVSSDKEFEEEKKDEEVDLSEHDPEEEDDGDKNDDDPDEKEEEEKEKDDSFQSDVTAQDSIVDITPVTGEQPVLAKVSVDSNAISVQQEENPSSASFTESERTELEALKREKKEALVNSYKDDLSEDEYSNFISNIDSFETYESLELELLKAYKNNKYTKVMRAFAFAPKKENVSKDNLDGFVQKNLRH